MTPDPASSPSLRWIRDQLAWAGWRSVRSDSRREPDGRIVFVAVVVSERDGRRLHGEGETPLEAWATVADLAWRADEPGDGAWHRGPPDSAAGELAGRS